MKKILVTDCGGSSCCWMAVDAGAVRHSFVTAGFNAAVAGDDAVALSVAEAAARLSEEGFIPDEIHFYGAGCGTPAACGRVSGILHGYFPDADAEVESDLVGAARATLGNSVGVACILGTGANAGLFDGGKLRRRIPPLGYVLGDEGSGAYLGKQLLVKVLRGELPAEIVKAFAEETGVDEAAAIERVYRTPGANAFLGSLAGFLSAHIDVPQLEEIVTDAFRAFRLTFVEPYLREESYNRAPLKIGVVGSVGAVFGKQLRSVFPETEVNVVRYPLEAMALYHCRGEA